MLPARLSILLAPIALLLASSPPARAAEPLPITELDPFVVQGEPLSISVFARDGWDRRYARRFAESVVEVAYDTMGKSTGHGLVVVGEQDDPHPIFVFQRFLDLSRDGRLPPPLQPAAQELEALLQSWKEKVDFDENEDSEFDIDFDAIVPAIPIPLEGIAAKLYLLAWEAGFKTENLDRSLAELSEQSLHDPALANYDWVFYLPPRAAFKQVLKAFLPEIMDQADLGPLKRLALRGAVAAFKPVIKDAIEGLRKGMLYYTVLRARSAYHPADIDSLTGAYIEALMPRGRIIPGNKKERAMDAIDAQKRENEELAKNPFVSPERLPDPDVEDYRFLAGDYGSNGKRTHSFTIVDGQCFWQYRDWEPGRFFPAGPTLFVSEKGDMTIEFKLDADGAPTSVEERWVRRKVVVPQRLASR